MKIASIGNPYNPQQNIKLFLEKKNKKDRKL